MTQSGTWIAYGGGARIALAVVLAAVAAAVAYAGFRLPLPARLPRPGRTVTILMFALYPAAILAFPGCEYFYVLHADREHIALTAPADPITPYTLIGAGVVFCVIAVAHNAHGWRTALGAAVRGAIAGPVIFELSFDLIVMTRTYPALPPDPALYRALFFAPLFLIEVLTLALLATSPVAWLSRPALWCVAGMLAVFAVWALLGFGFPAGPATITLNVLSKVLALLAALAVFVPARAEPGTRAPAQRARAASGGAWAGVM